MKVIKTKDEIAFFPESQTEVKRLDFLKEYWLELFKMKAGQNEGHQNGTWDRADS